MFEIDVRICFDWLCTIGVCCCFAAFVFALCLKLMFGYFVNGYVEVGVCFCFAVVVDDWCLKLMLGYVVVGYGKLMFVFDLPCLLMVSV